MKQLSLTENRFAHFSTDRVFRFSLYVQWNDRLPTLIAIGLNPSVADEERDDPTIRRLKGFARSWGYGQLVMLNLFALVSTDPKQLKKVEDPVGYQNTVDFMRSHIRNAGATWALACWGTGSYPKILDREQQVYDGLRLKCLRLTASGSPAHPLYLPGNLVPKPYNYKEEA